MSIRTVRPGELLALAGAACAIVSLLKPWYQAPSGNLDAWDTFGPGVVLLALAIAGALRLVLSTLAERSSAAPVRAVVWAVALALIAVIAALVRLLERPQHATGLCAGAWLALIGAVAMLVGAWLSVRDERGALYAPATPKPRPRP
jgi:hypothetical protein